MTKKQRYQTITTYTIKNDRLIVDDITNHKMPSHEVGNNNIVDHKMPSHEVANYKMPIHEVANNTMSAKNGVNNETIYKELKDKINDGYTTVFIDGTYRKQEKIGGYAVYFNENDYRNKVGKVEYQNLNSYSCELYALYMFVLGAENLKNYVIICDNELIISAINQYIGIWSRNNFKKANTTIDIKHKDLVIKIHNLIEEKKLKLYGHHVKGHQKQPNNNVLSMEYILWEGNRKVDKLAEKFIKNALKTHN